MEVHNQNKIKKMFSINKNIKKKKKKYREEAKMKNIILKLFYLLVNI